MSFERSEEDLHARAIVMAAVEIDVVGAESHSTANFVRAVPHHLTQRNTTHVHKVHLPRHCSLNKESSEFAVCVTLEKRATMWNILDENETDLTLEMSTFTSSISLFCHMFFQCETPRKSHLNTNFLTQKIVKNKGRLEKIGTHSNSALQLNTMLPNSIFLSLTQRITRYCSSSNDYWIKSNLICKGALLIPCTTRSDYTWRLVSDGSIFNLDHQDKIVKLFIVNIPKRSLLTKTVLLPKCVRDCVSVCVLWGVIYFFKSVDFILLQAWLGPSFFDNGWVEPS